MSKEMVTIAEFVDLNDAHLLRSRLEAEDIPVFLQDEYITCMRPAPFNAYAKALLQVPGDDVEHAMAILREVHPERFPQTDLARPPASALRGALKLFAIVTAFVAMAALFSFLAARGRGL
ncbi:MAG: DUF2007 domain-containing protein [FCB group bacterium]|jgi:hypothetical protein|nr:DUF2007 domain-containing protein [FCB group bacterium]